QKLSDDRSGLPDRIIIAAIDDRSRGCQRRVNRCGRYTARRRRRGCSDRLNGLQRKQERKTAKHWVASRVKSEVGQRDRGGGLAGSLDLGEGCARHWGRRRRPTGQARVV